MAKTRDYMDYLDDNVKMAPATSQEEYQAAETIANVLRDHKLETSIEEFDAHPWGMVVPSVLVLIMFVCLIVAKFTTGPVRIATLLVAILVAGLTIFVHYTGSDILRNLGPAVSSQNVVGIHRATGSKVVKGARPIVIVAHYDTPRENFLRSGHLARYQSALRMVSIFCHMAVAVTVIFQLFPFVPEVLQTIMWVIGLVAMLPLLVLAVSDIYSRFSRYTAGSNDNKASVAAMLAIANKVRPMADRVDDEIEKAGPDRAQRRRAKDAPPAPPAPQRVEIMEEVKGVRHGAAVLESLGILPPDCEIVYEEPRIQIVEQTAVEVLSESSSVADEVDTSDADISEDEAVESDDASTEQVEDVYDEQNESDFYSDEEEDVVEEPDDQEDRDSSQEHVRSYDEEEEEYQDDYDDETEEYEDEALDYEDEAEEYEDEEEYEDDYDEEDEESEGDSYEDTEDEDDYQESGISPASAISTVGSWFTDRVANVKELLSKRSKHTEEDYSDEAYEEDYDGDDEEEYEDYDEDDSEEYEEYEEYEEDGAYDEDDAEEDEQLEDDEDPYDDDASYDEDESYDDDETYEEESYEEDDEADSDYSEEESYEDDYDEDDYDEEQYDEEDEEPAEYDDEDEPAEEHIEEEQEPIAYDDDAYTEDDYDDEEPYDEEEPYEEDESADEDEYEEDDYDEDDDDYDDEEYDEADDDYEEVEDDAPRLTIGNRISNLFRKIRIHEADVSDFAQDDEASKRLSRNGYPERSERYKEDPEEKEVFEDAYDESDFYDESYDEEVYDSDDSTPSEEMQYDYVETEPSESYYPEDYEEDFDYEVSYAPDDDLNAVSDDETVEDDVAGEREERATERLVDPNELHIDREQDADILPKDTTGIDIISDSYDLYTEETVQSGYEKPAPLTDPGWGVSSYQPALPSVNIARRAALFDLPDPSSLSSDPFDDYEEYDDEYDEYEDAEMPVDEPSVLEDPKSADVIEHNDAPVPHVEERFEKEPVVETVPDTDEGSNAVSDDSNKEGRKKSFWGSASQWKGGATVRDDLRGDDAPIVIDADDLQDAILELGDEFLVAHDIWFVATGASEINHAGIQAFLDNHKRDIRGAFLVNLECVGAGDLSVLVQEGFSASRRADRRLVRMITSIAQDLHIQIDNALLNWGETDSATAMRSRVRSVTVAGLDENVMPAYSHTSEDVPENVNPKQVYDVVRMVTELIRRA